MAALNELITRWYLQITNGLADEEGQGLVEYALIISVVAVMLVATLVLLKGNISNTFNTIGNHLSSGT